jgi:hypothetical protein
MLDPIWLMRSIQVLSSIQLVEALIGSHASLCNLISWGSSITCIQQTLLWRWELSIANDLGLVRALFSDHLHRRLAYALTALCSLLELRAEGVLLLLPLYFLLFHSLLLLSPHLQISKVFLVEDCLIIIFSHLSFFLLLPPEDLFLVDYALGLHLKFPFLFGSISDLLDFKLFPLHFELCPHVKRDPTCRLRILFLCNLVDMRIPIGFHGALLVVPCFSNPSHFILFHYCNWCCYIGFWVLAKLNLDQPLLGKSILDPLNAIHFLQLSQGLDHFQGCNIIGPLLGQPLTGGRKIYQIFVLSVSVNDSVNFWTKGFNQRKDTVNRGLHRALLIHSRISY